jgi:hypothetical protein
MPIDPKSYPRIEVGDDTNLLANKKKHKLEFFHVPSGYSVSFKAMMSNISYGFDQRWNDDNVYGRNDPISAYQGTGRTIEVSWEVVATDLREGAENMERASILAHFQYGNHEDIGPLATTIAEAPLMRVKFCNLIMKPDGSPGGTAKLSGLLCRTDGLTIVPDLEAGMFDPEPGVLFFKKYNISTNLIVLHEHSLGMHEKNRLRKGGQGFPFGVKFNGAESVEVAATAREQAEEELADIQRSMEETLVQNDVMRAMERSMTFFGD